MRNKNTQTIRPTGQRTYPLGSTNNQLNGAKETRTPDPLHAMQVLYQLSYGPMPRVILSEELVNAKNNTPLGVRPDARPQ